MHKIDATDPEAQSADLVAGNIATLKALFPELITEGADGAAVNVDVLKALVGDATVSDAEEKYGLNWHGKRRARQLALTPSTGTLRPCPEDSVDWDTTQNLMIEGDNLEVLKLLQKSYAGKVKLIYIDPPYNTGKDFVYPDNFQDSIKNYLELTGQAEGGAKVSSNTEVSGRFHTDWLNMMFPRLKLAKNLLQPDGVIFISIDDQELASVKFVCDEVFGGENFIGRCTWERKRKGSHLSSEFTQKTESLVIYAKGEGKVSLFGEPAGADEDQPLIKRTNAAKELKIPGGCVETGMANQLFRKGIYGEGSSAVELLQDVRVEGGFFIDEVWLRGPFIWSQENLDEERLAGARFFIRTENFSLRALKAPERQGFKALSSFLPRTVGTNEDALSELADLFQVDEDRVPFSYPKPLGYINKIVSAATHWNKDAVVLDFFAGSGTTAHSVLSQNALNGGCRRYVLVQLPEPLDPKNKDQQVAAEFCDQLGKPRNIAELTKERLRRAGAKVKADSPDWQGDTGFRVYKLDQSNIRAWQPSGNLEQDLVDSVEHIVPGRSEQDVLTELLLKLGLDLCVPIEQRQIGGKTVHAIGGGVLMACLDPRIGKDDAESLALGIADWHTALTPAGDTTCVFRDSAFENDEAKTNLAAILEQHGIHHVRSL